ncbi:MAG TPA: molybdopterin dinucleotide binding domain-containing protein, partial [Gemmatales bacterium]|nr:molybdopterin dinucleotide binding domain-containing protein [Gemmatales bacterium]
RAQAGRPTLEIHPVDAEPRRIATGDPVRIWNDRGEYFAHALVGPTVARGTVAALGLWWREHTRGGFNCNATTSTRLTDFGGGATFFDNLVEVARVAPEAARS